MWVRSIQTNLGTIEVETSIEMALPQAGGRRAELLVEANPGRYAYGLPIFLGLLLAVRRPRRWAYALGGYVLLLPVQAFSLTFYVLMQMVLFAQPSPHVLAVSQWQIEAIVYGYQLGSLVLPTVMPIVLWLWLDRQFVNEVLVRSWQRRVVSVVSIAPVAPCLPAQRPLARPVRPSAPEISSSTAAVLPQHR